MRQLLEVYLTVTTAIAVGLLSLFNVVDSRAVSAATLSVLALVAFHLTARRPTTPEIVLPGPPALGGDAVPSIREARDIRIIGVTLNRTMRTLLHDLEHRLAQGARVQVAIIDPGGGVPREAARRCALPDGARFFEHRLKPTLDLLRYLQAGSGRIEVRLLPFVPAFGLFMVDSATAGGTITVAIYSHRPSGREVLLTLQPSRDQYWYEHFRSEFDQIWAAGRPVQIACAQNVLAEAG